MDCPAPPIFVVIIVLLGKIFWGDERIEIRDIVLFAVNKNKQKILEIFIHLPASSIYLKHINLRLCTIHKHI